MNNFTNKDEMFFFLYANQNLLADVAAICNYWLFPIISIVL